MIRLALACTLILFPACGSSPTVDPQPPPAALEDPVPAQPAPAEDPAPPPPADDAIPELTLAQLLAEPVEPGRVQVTAWVHETLKCSHGADSTLLATGKPGSGPDRISVKGGPPAGVEMLDRVPYTLVLELAPGYEKGLVPAGCAPDLPIEIVECLDCEDPPIPLVTFAQLRQEGAAPGVVKVEAFLLGWHEPSPCPPKHKCQPCSSTVRLADSADDGPDDQVTVIGSRPKKTKKGRRYTFLLELQEGFESALEGSDCDPRFNKIRLYRCLDCP